MDILEVALQRDFSGKFPIPKSQLLLEAKTSKKHSSSRDLGDLKAK